jgi:20S proteasome alpha/beta subunit
MTTVIVDRVEGKVYSDSRATSTTISGIFKKVENVEYSEVDKIFRVNNHVLTGSGSLRLLHEVVERFRSCKKLPSSFYINSGEYHQKTIILVNKFTGGRYFSVQYNLSAKSLPFGKVRVSVVKSAKDDSNQYTIIGSGGLLATGAMEQGATPEEAIQIASKHDQYTDDNVVEVSL